MVIPGEDLIRRLEIESAAAHALLAPSLGTRLGILEARRREAEAMALWERSPFPGAVFRDGARSPSRTNTAWRELFGALELPETALASVAEVQRTSETIHVPEIDLSSGGALRYCAAVLRPLRGCLGAPEGVIAVCAATTDAVLAARQGVDATALLWTGEQRSGLVWFNQRWRSYTAADEGEPWQRAIHADDLARCVHAFQEALRLRVSMDVEARIVQSSGTYRWHRVRFSTEESGARWFGVATDHHDELVAETERAELISNAHAARDDAEQANRLKDQFLAAVSHELRAPMTTMLLWVKILRDETSDEATRAQALSAIQESATAQSRLVGDLLDVARGISGKLYVDLRTVDLARICTVAVAAISHVAVAKRVTLVISGCSYPADVQGDEARLRQVIDNLLSNAVKFTEADGTVTVALQRKGRRMCVDISDTGCGITPDFLPHIFEVFSQTEDVLTRERGGLGLGLAIVKQLVELHSGTVTGTSEGHGRGATFSVTLPASGASRAASPPVGVPLIPGLAGVRVLVVDDDPRVREALAHLLARAGAAVDAAGSSAEARERITAQAPSVIVCDIAMPGEDGYSFVRSLRGGGSGVPVIALTAHARDADAKRALAAGFDRHLAKPIDFDVLLASVHELLVARST
ncbi:MAG: response regulator [Deltaproteobacteria bacterium]|nr:response regulator [Deltaproteobacteria bacterium]